PGRRVGAGAEVSRAGLAGGRRRRVGGRAAGGGGGVPQRVGHRPVVGDRDARRHLRQGGAGGSLHGVVHLGHGPGGAGRRGGGGPGPARARDRAVAHARRERPAAHDHPIDRVCGARRAGGADRRGPGGRRERRPGGLGVQHRAVVPVAGRRGGGAGGGGAESVDRRAGRTRRGRPFAAGGAAAGGGVICASREGRTEGRDLSLYSCSFSFVRGSGRCSRRKRKIKRKRERGGGTTSLAPAFRPCPGRGAGGRLRATCPKTSSPFTTRCSIPRVACSTPPPAAGRSVIWRAWGRSSRGSTRPWPVFRPAPRRASMCRRS